MSMQYSRRHFLQALLAGGGLLGATSLISVLPAAPALARGAGAAEQAESQISRTALFMGTMVSISVDRASAAQAGEALERAFALGRALEAQLTRFESAAPLAVVNSNGFLGDAPPVLSQLLEHSLEMHRLTGGAFDPTVLPLVRLLENSRERGASLSAAEAREALQLVGAEHISLADGGLRFKRSGMALTLDGIAKGQIADAMSRELTAAGCPNHCVNAGGDIVARGVKAGNAPWRVAVEDPRGHGRSRYPQVLDLAGGGAVATSGVYQIFYDAAHGRSHLVNPATGLDAAQASVTVAAPDCRTADALATALSVMPPREALALADALPGCSCCLVQRDGLVRVSRAWPGHARRA